MSKALRQLQARKADTVARARAITDTAAAANRDITPEEKQDFDALLGQADALEADIQRQQRLAAAEAAITIPAGTTDIVVTERRQADAKGGFRSFGDFAQSVIRASVNPRATDERLIFEAAAPTTFGSTMAGADGGFLIPPEFATEIYTLSLMEDALLPLTANVELSSSNSMVFPKDETTPWGTDGVRAYWQAEATAGTATKPKLSTNIMRLHKLMALVPLTDELIEDARALETYIPDKVAQSIRWKTNESFLFGAAAGQPIGAFNANGPAILQAKESAQATLTLLLANITKMVSHLPPGSYGRAIWLLNNDVLPALAGLTLGNYPIYLPIGGALGGIVGAPPTPGGNMLQTPYGTLQGRPVYVSQHANTFSSQGDVMLGDFKGYRTITKAGGMETATSMHLYFDADATAFRTLFRIDGMPVLQTPINPAKGSNQLSHFVQLAAR
jgi:HK97 family phage major capsid protein